jgi:hypothetical protein
MPCAPEGATGNVDCGSGASSTYVKNSEEWEEHVSVRLDELASHQRLD